MRLFGERRDENSQNKKKTSIIIFYESYSIYLSAELFIHEL
jgi:hypothetical protein